MERASSVRVGHHLGNNDVPSAKFILKLTFGVASAICKQNDNVGISVVFVLLCRLQC